jgi:acetoin utilization protein AcuB
MMTKAPYVIRSDQSMKIAHDLMRRHRIRHLPVIQSRKLVGLVSLRDLHLLETLPDVDVLEVRVAEAMSPEVYSVRPATPLKRVVREMATRKLGSAVVVKRGKVVGVFTTVDALKALAALLPD